MANIERSDGTIVSWGGDVVGPECVLNEMGRPTGWNKFKTECAIDGEIHEVSFVILDSELKIFGAVPTRERDERIRHCVAQHFEKQLRDNRQKAPERKEQFTLTASDLRNCQPSIAERPKKWICTVQLPVEGKSPEFHDIEVSDYSNAVTILEKHLPKNPLYLWNSARVVKKDLKG
jgi:hypothetical protein